MDADCGSPLGRRLLAALRRHGQRQLMVYTDSGQTLTAAAIADRSQHMLGCLRAKGVRAGDVLVLCCGHTEHIPPLMVGALSLGAVCAPLNPAYDRGDLQRLLALLQPKLVFAGADAAAALRPLLARLETVPELVAVGGGAGWRAFASAPRAGPPEAAGGEPGTRAAFIMCSSGTTGLPKGVQLTHASLSAFLDVMSREDMSPVYSDVVLNSSPIFWISGTLFPLLSMDKGVKIVIVPQFQEEVYLQTIEKYKVTFLFCAPNAMLALARRGAEGPADLSSLRYLSSGGAPLTADLERLIEGLMGAPLYQWYGMTEVLLTHGPRARRADKPGCVGATVPSMECKVVDVGSGEPLPANKHGELCIRGPYLTAGYYRNEEATSATIDSEGWLHTGDVGYYDEDSEFFIVDRIKELIKYRGEHVAASELEALLMQHPGVREAAVVGVHSDLDQEHPKAFVVKQAGSAVAEAELVRLVAGEGAAAAAEHEPSFLPIPLLLISGCVEGFLSLMPSQRQQLERFRDTFSARWVQVYSHLQRMCSNQSASILKRTALQNLIVVRNDVSTL